MLAFLINILFIIGAMGLFFRYMYPKPPQAYFAKAGDDISLRTCDFCGGKLATYRGILIPKSLDPSTDEQTLAYTFCKDNKNTITDDCYFFCNQDHQTYYCQHHKDKKS